MSCSPGRGVELGPCGVTVTTVVPGPSDNARDLSSRDPSQREDKQSRDPTFTPIGRLERRRIVAAIPRSSPKRHSGLITGQQIGPRRLECIGRKGD